MPFSFTLSGLLHWCLLLASVWLPFAPASFAWEESPVTVSSFPKEGILPKTETGALRFLEQHPEYDGRGVLVAVFDTGIDPAAPGLARTSDGQTKIVDLIDATGSGDIPMSTTQEAADGLLKGLSGRVLKIDPRWKNPSGKYRLGLKAGYDLFPQELVERLTERRKEQFERRQRQLEAELEDQLVRVRAGEDQSLKAAEVSTRLKVLRDAWEHFEDAGPVYDCVAFHDGDHWRAAIDTNEDGDLGDETALANYAVEQQYATFRQESHLNFSVNFYDDGKLLSVVVPSGDHGTHVAGILAAFDPQRPERNGLAPGARIVSINIGDNRLGSMETGAALLRGLQVAVSHHCDLINMSYGEPTATPNAGALIEKFNEIVREKQIIFVAAAGNNGPALSTVGCPGGTTSAVIGVGAYVSPKMMEAEYTLRDPSAGQAYSWSSRGPAADGDPGVDLFAPGGAISPVPEYMLQPGLQMNGTSMASPNACGNIALLVSGFKQLQQPYSPASVLRSLQATAQRLPEIDLPAQGAGLIQVDRAFEHHTRWQSAPGQHVELEVSLPHRQHARGIYLREPFETEQIFEQDVELQPYFEETEETLRRLEYELPLKLVSTADWVQVGGHVLLTGSGEQFSVRVDPTQLEPGLHVAEILVQDAEHPERGPLARVPVVVTKPHRLERFDWEADFESTTAGIARHFLAVPEGATSATLRISREGGETYCIFLVHALQLAPGRSYEELDTEFPVGLTAGGKAERSFPVLGGRTLEVCVAQFWTQTGDSQLHLEVEFHGLASAESTLALSADGAPALVDVTAKIRQEKCQPHATLTQSGRLLRPQSSKLKLLGAERDSLWNHQRTSHLVLNYEAELEHDQKVWVQCPQFRGLLYESPVASFRMFVFDDHQRLVHSDDTEAEPVTLKKGTYQIRVELRDVDRERLRQFAALPLLLVANLDSPITLLMDHDRTSSLAELGDFEEVTLQPERKTTIFIKAPHDAEFPEELSRGDQLMGELFLTSSRVAGIPVTLEFADVEEDEQDAEDKHDSKTEDVTVAESSQFQLKAAELKFWLTSLKSLTWPEDRKQIDELVRRIEKRDPGNREVRVARLHLLDNDDREERLPEIIAAADEVLKRIDQQQLRNFFSRRHDDPDASVKKQIQAFEAEKKDLFDALYRKGRALGYQELPEVTAQHPIEDQHAHDELFNKNYAELASWVETSGPEYFLLRVRKEWRSGNYGAALEVLTKTSATLPAKQLYLEKRRDLFELLGWDIWRDNQQAWILRKFPQVKEPF